jgi:hypothetical protein
MHAREGGGERERRYQYSTSIGKQKGPLGRHESENNARMNLGLIGKADIVMDLAEERDKSVVNTGMNFRIL